MANDLSKFSRGSQLHVLGKAPRLSVARVLLAMAVLGGTLVSNGAKAGPVAADVTVHDGGAVARMKVVDASAAKVVRGPSLATPRPQYVAPPTAVVARDEADKGGDMARSLLEMMGDGADDDAVGPAPVAPTGPVRATTYVTEAPPMTGRSVGTAGERPEMRGRAPVDVSPQPPFDRDGPDQELDSDGETTLTGTAPRPGRISPEDRFAAPPPGNGKPRAVAPPSRFGVQYSWKSSLHEHDVPEGREIVEGGFTDRSKAEVKGFLPQVPDPSDAFMNTAIQAVMQNTGQSFEDSVKQVEDLLVKAKLCVEHFGPDHACSAQGAGVTFDYGARRFAVDLTTRSTQDGDKVKPLRTGTVAYETPKGMYEGPLFDKVMLAQPQAAPRAP